MTKARSLRTFFKKFFDLDSTGMSVSAVLDEITQNNETFPVGGGSDSSSGSSGLYAPIEYESRENELFSIPFSYNQIKAATEAGGTVTISDTFEDQTFGGAGTKFYNPVSLTVGAMGNATVYFVMFYTARGNEDVTLANSDPDAPLLSPASFMGGGGDTTG